MHKLPDHESRRSIPIAAWVLSCGFILCLFPNCAKVGSPTGGPRDENPPVVTGSVPDNKAVGNKPELLEITFDEFIVLKNLNDELVISPPLKEKPVTRIRNKTLVIDLNNELRDSTTYTLNFGNAIADNNEGNLLADYEFVFSTGPAIDSLAVTGIALNAFSLKPEKDKLFVMLYENLNDSTPYRDLPLYITKTSAEGKFAINNIRPGTYKIFALKDGNNNLMFDMTDEMIAFGDSTLVISPGNVEKINFVKDSSLNKARATLPRKGKNAPADTAQADTVKVAGREFYAVNTSLFLFTEEDMRQNVIARERERRELLTFAFSRPLFDSVRLDPLNFTARRWCLEDYSANRDTARFWITDTSLIRRDTLSFALAYTATDSAGNFVTRTDTVFMRYRPKEARGKPGRKDKEGEDSPDSLLLNLSTNIRKGSVFDLNQPLMIISPRPFATNDINRLLLTRMEDTLEFPQPIGPLDDTSSLYAIRYKVNWEENSNYTLKIFPGAVTDIYGATHDTTVISFRTQRSDHYGRIILSCDSSEMPLIIQLMDEKENRIAEKYLEENGQVIFDYLQPKKYRIKAIVDVNRNKKWDTGRYLGRIQPEKVVYYPDLIDVRSNWDVELAWDGKQ